MRLLSVLLPVCLVASGCTSEKDARGTLPSEEAEFATPVGQVVAPDGAPAVVEQDGLKKGKALDGEMGYSYSGTVVLSGQYILETYDSRTGEQVCFAPDSASAQKLPDTESSGYLCFTNQPQARKLLKIKAVKWEPLPENLCRAVGNARVTVTDYEDVIADGDMTDLARVVSVQATSPQKLARCDGEEEGNDADSEEAPLEPKESQTDEASQGGSWPSDLGTYRTSSSAGIPAFPKRLEGFRPRGDAQSGIIRVFEGKGWTGIHEFEVGANGCSHSLMMVRWRSANAITIQTSTAGSHIDESAPDAPASTHGYMFGSRCDQPAFKFGKTEGTSTLVDVFYEVQHWDAAP